MGLGNQTLVRNKVYLNSAKNTSPELWSEDLPGVDLKGIVSSLCVVFFFRETFAAKEVRDAPQIKKKQNPLISGSALPSSVLLGG